MKTNKQHSPQKLTSIFAMTVLMILAISLVNSKKNPIAADDQNNNKTPRTPVPTALACNWQTGTISSVNFYNPVTGIFGPPSGTGMFFKFMQNGYYEKGVLLQSSLYGHTTSFFAYNKGTMTVQDSVIVLYSTYGRIKSVDNLVAANNYEKDDELVSETMVWVRGIGKICF